MNIKDIMATDNYKFPKERQLTPLVNCYVHPEDDTLCIKVTDVAGKIVTTVELSRDEATALCDWLQANDCYP